MAYLVEVSASASLGIMLSTQVYAITHSGVHYVSKMYVSNRLGVMYA